MFIQTMFIAVTWPQMPSINLSLVYFLVPQADKPKLKFSVKYNSSRSTLVVDLLESKNVGRGNLVHDTPPRQDSPNESSFLSGLNVFSPVELSPTPTKQESRAIKRVRKNSFEFEMDYDELQLQMLQFSVMAYDEYSRQKVLGDVVFFLAEFTNQGLDITRELIMWREVQTMEKVKGHSVD
ncbi:hypothetical protein AC249_AIPGENE28418 [Exaiptasia diaphana]|nr:hypothetical protein AC249_AIPGENE28418 [Exaiptasia diaphana]